MKESVVEVLLQQNNESSGESVDAVFSERQLPKEASLLFSSLHFVSPDIRSTIVDTGEISSYYEELNHWKKQFKISSEFEEYKNLLATNTMFALVSFLNDVQQNKVRDEHYKKLSSLFYIVQNYPDFFLEKDSSFRERLYDFNKFSINCYDNRKIPIGSDFNHLFTKPELREEENDFLIAHNEEVISQRVISFAKGFAQSVYGVDVEQKVSPLMMFEIHTHWSKDAIDRLSLMTSSFLPDFFGKGTMNNEFKMLLESLKHINKHFENPNMPLYKKQDLSTVFKNGLKDIEQIFENMKGLTVDAPLGNKKVSLQKMLYAPLLQQIIEEGNKLKVNLTPYLPVQKVKKSMKP